jgi:hypothetical protein
MLSFSCAEESTLSVRRCTDAEVFELDHAASARLRVVRGKRPSPGFL